MIDRVARREADFGLRFAPARDPAIEAEVLKASDIAAIMPASHPLARLGTVPIGALAGQDIITCAPHTAIGKPVDEAFRDAGIPLNRRIQVSHSMTAFILAARGAGIALVEPMLLSGGAMPDLVARPIRPRIEVRTPLIHAIGRPPTKTSDKLVELIRLQMERMDGSGRVPAIG